MSHKCLTADTGSAASSPRCDSTLTASPAHGRDSKTLGVVNQPLSRFNLIIEVSIPLQIDFQLLTIIDLPFNVSQLLNYLTSRMRL